MKKNYFAGIDVSKQTIDVAFIMQDNQQKTQPCWKIFDNNEHGFCQMKTWLQNNQVPFNEDTLFVIENTGLYHRLLVKFCNKPPVAVMHREWSTGKMEPWYCPGKK